MGTLDHVNPTRLSKWHQMSPYSSWQQFSSPEICNHTCDSRSRHSAQAKAKVVPHFVVKSLYSGVIPLNSGPLRPALLRTWQVIITPTSLSQSSPAYCPWDNCKGTSRVTLSHYWGSVLLVAQWQYVYAFPSFLSSLCLCRVVRAFYSIIRTLWLLIHAVMRPPKKKEFPVHLETWSTTSSYTTKPSYK